MIREAMLKDCIDISMICSIDLGYSCDEQLIEKRLANLDSKRECVYVAEIEGHVVGFIHIEKYDLLYFSSMANILGIAVSGKVRRQGIGKQLIVAAEEWAKSNNIFEMRLNSGESRKEAHSFYRNLGYSNEKMQLRFTKKL